MDDDETAAVLAEALAGSRLSRRAALQLAASLRRVTGAFPAGAGNLADSPAALTPPQTSSAFRPPHQIDSAPETRRSMPDHDERTDPSVRERPSPT